ncbi:ommochrome-binding protein-like [Maniola jurtina]|uniref:ommochrome-binding protein-like n=1 Tax=Maniola jurtina TaxID=191418 RepID=UPI001E687520|nr:ommochrome-binding protein-like [Maniola jurtina]
MLSQINLAVSLVLLVCVEARIRVYVTDTPIEKIGSRLYKKELLTDKFNDPKELAYDSATRNLFFMHMDDLIQNSGRAYVNIITKDTMKINGIARNKATAVDAENGEVYFGSDNGLYKYDPLLGDAVNIGLYNMNILKIVIRNNEMYVIDANNHKIYKIFDQGSKAILVGNMKSVLEFDVDYYKNIHYVSMCGVYCALNGDEIVKNKDLTVVYHFISDEYTTFGVTENGLYEIDCFNGTAKHVANLSFFPRSIIFGDYGDIFYSVDNSIFRLKPISSYTVYNVRRKET